MRKVIQQLEEENKNLKEQVKDLDLTILILKGRIRELEKQGKHYYEKIKELSDVSSKYYKEIEKLKEVINIINTFLPDLYFTQSDNSKDVILVYDGGGYCGELTREEYELLKEVFSDDK